MHVITAPYPVACRVDVDAAKVLVLSTWSTNDRALSGLPADRILVQVTAPCVTAEGSAVVISSQEEGAVNPGRRARVIAEMQAWADKHIAFLRTLPVAEEPVVATKPAKVVKPAAPKAKPEVCSPNSNNDEIAKSIVRRADIDAVELGDKLAASHVGSCFDVYIAKHQLSEKRSAGIKTKLNELGHAW